MQTLKEKIKEIIESEAFQDEYGEFVVTIKTKESGTKQTAFGEQINFIPDATELVEAILKEFVNYQNTRTVLFEKT